jgi:hypothetical protein
MRLRRILKMSILREKEGTVHSTSTRTSTKVDLLWIPVSQRNFRGNLRRYIRQTLNDWDTLAMVR